MTCYLCFVYLFILGGVVGGIVCDDTYIYVYIYTYIHTYTYFSIYPGCIRVIRNSWFIFLEIPTSSDLHSIFPLKIQGETHVYITRWNMIGSNYIYIYWDSNQPRNWNANWRKKTITWYSMMLNPIYYHTMYYVHIYICLYVVVYVCTIYTHRIIPPQMRRSTEHVCEMMGETGWNRGKAMVWPLCSMYGIFTYIWAIFGVNVGKYSIHGASGWWQCVLFCGLWHVMNPIQSWYFSNCN
jgi:hypothetical protein